MEKLLCEFEAQRLQSKILIPFKKQQQMELNKIMK
jgi:hypothetical protein